MSYPTVLGPWYVIFRIRDDGTASGDYKPPEYYTAMEESETNDPFQPNKKIALLFTSLQSAARVADAEVAEVRVLYSKEHAEEFSRG